MYVTPGLSYLNEILQVSAGVQVPVDRVAQQTENFAIIGKLTFFVDAMYPIFAWKPF